MKRPTLPPEFIKQLRTVNKKRPRTVIDHILEHGYVTTEELKTLYGYEHPPRAARDVREEGIPLETFRVRNAEGRSIGAYRFADTSTVRGDRAGGRKTFSKQFKESLLAQSGSVCAICLVPYEKRYLQVDHRVPYEVAGDNGGDERHVHDFMLLCGSCNRAKSWSCVHCANWSSEHNEAVCSSCYWAHPNAYKHIALRSVRRIDVVWENEEVQVYDKLKAIADASDETMPAYVKRILKRHVK